MIPVWFDAHIAQFEQQLKQGKLAHALLLSSQPGCQLSSFSQAMVRQLLCEHQQFNGCKRCKHCKLLTAGSHPDYLHISSEQGKAITVDAARQLIPFINATAAVASCKVVLIEQAHLMNQNAANAILKVLEEPSADSFILLQTSYAQHLLPTIKSRCQHWSTHPPTNEQCLLWLKQQEGDFSDVQLKQALRQANDRPLQALSNLSEQTQALHKQLNNGLEQLFKQQVGAVELAQTWSKLQLEPLLSFIESCIVSSIKLQVAAQSDGFVCAENKKIIAFTAKKIQKQDLFTFYDKVSRYNLSVKNNKNLNVLLLIEDILINWYQLIFKH